MTRVDLNETVVAYPDIPADIIEALHARALCQGGAYMTAQEAMQQHLDMLADGYYTKAERQAAIAAEKKLIERGSEYFEQGYRLEVTDRAPFGVPITIPTEALAWRLVSAGYVGTGEMRRIQYVTRLYSSTEAMAYLKISKITLRRARKSLEPDRVTAKTHYYHRATLDRWNQTRQPAGRPAQS